MKKPPEKDKTQPGGERLQKLLASAGVASRRAAEEMIAQGRVKVNGQVVKEMGVRADPEKDRIEVDGKPIRAPEPSPAHEQFVYIALNKPEGVVTTSSDTHGRPTVLDVLRPAHLRERGIRVYPVGRLDIDTTGLLLLTNDGDLTFRLTHPRFGVDKEYRALARGRLTHAEIQRLRDGVEIEGEKTAPAKVEETGRNGENTWLRVTIHEGKKRQVRLMLAAVGHPALELQRTRFGPITLGTLEPGKWRFLAVHEIHALRKAVNVKAVPRPGEVRRAPGKLGASPRRPEKPGAAQPARHPGAATQEHRPRVQRVRPQKPEQGDTNGKGRDALRQQREQRPHPPRPGGGGAAPRRSVDTPRGSARRPAKDNRH